ncbi:thiazole synthase [mine drainage metagenome]|uniref:thiazole synthase n=1 Tax=mine drainage metagenome TaxID=410659 RepID=A0A1J5QXI3_9ZZZZ
MECDITAPERDRGNIAPVAPAPAASTAPVAAPALRPPPAHDDDSLHVAGAMLRSRLLLGTARYPSPDALAQAAAASGAEVFTVGLRRLQPASGGGAAFWQRVRELGGRLLPNTAGCHDAEQAVNLARMARELFGTYWIKLEVIGDDYTLQPDPWATVEAAQILVREGFDVFAYTTDDLVTALRLHDAGVAAIMPWAAPIGTGAGPRNLPALRTLRERLPDSVLVVDAGIGAPHHAAQVMELGYDAVLVNTAVAEAGDPAAMARAFALAVESGRLARRALPIRERDVAQASTPMVGVPFWHQAGG